MSRCICDFPESCNCEGVLYCEGCGGEDRDDWFDDSGDSLEDA